MKRRRRLVVKRKRRLVLRQRKQEEMALLSDDIRQLVEELEDRVTAQEKEEENFDIEEELELAKAEGELLKKKL